MASYLDMTAANALLKEYYDDQRVHSLVYKDNPALALVPKDEDAQGEYIPIPTIYETSMGASSSFSTAQGNQVPLQAAKFLLTVKPGYSIATIQEQAIRASASDKGAFLRLAKTNIDGAIRREKNRLAAFLFRSGTGSIGKISTVGTVGTGVIQLTNVGDIVHFGVNQTIQANATDGGATPRAALGYVISVNRTLGQLTVASSGIGGAAANPSGWQATDFLLTQGDNNATLSGFAAWVGSSDPTSTDNFYGVNRSADVNRLGGLRYDGSAQTIEEALVDASSLVAREGGMPEHCFVPFSSWGSLEKALGAKVQYVSHEGPAQIMFRGIRINGANTTIDVFPDRSQQAATAHLLQMDTWKLYSYGPAPGIIRYSENLDMLRVYNADASEVRCGEYANLGCEAPGWNINVTLSG